jgi:hypothetical protein
MSFFGGGGKKPDPAAAGGGDNPNDPDAANRGKYAAPPPCPRCELTRNQVR